jgi:tetratricopeptide (TPR) repeat protein
MSALLQFVPERLPPWIKGWALFIATIIVYLPVRHAGFIWDDDNHLTANPCVVGACGFKEIWVSGSAFYYPLVISAFRMEYNLWGLSPEPFHLVVVLLHATDALLLWATLRALKIQGAWLGAALWALHPVQVESVAWITEQKNTQSCLFYLLSILFFIKWREIQQNWGQKHWKQWTIYLMALLSAVLAVLSKTSTVMLPVILCLCQWWIKGRRDRSGRLREFTQVIPFFLISALGAIWTIWEQRFHSGALGGGWDLGWAERLIVAVKVPLFYLGKLAWPDPLIFIYPRWSTDALSPSAWLPMILCMAAVFALWRLRNQSAWLRALFFALACFLVSLFPVMGFFNIYFFRYSFVGDHFQYLASMAPLALAGAAVVQSENLLRSKQGYWRGLVPIVSGLLLVILGWLSVRECAKYAGNEELWKSTLERDPNCFLALNNLGNLLADRGQAGEATSLFKRALTVDTRSAEVHSNLASVLIDQGELDQASIHLREALELNPRSSESHLNLGKLLLQQGSVEEGLTEYRKAADLNTNSSRGHLLLAQVLAQRGRWEDALTEYKNVLLHDPHNEEAMSGTGTSLLATGRNDEALKSLEMAIGINPSRADAHNNLGIAYVRTGRMADAEREFTTALHLDPSNPDYLRHFNNAHAGAIDRGVLPNK